MEDSASTTCHSSDEDDLPSSYNATSSSSSFSSSSSSSPSSILASSSKSSLSDVSIENSVELNITDADLMTDDEPDNEKPKTCDILISKTDPGSSQSTEDTASSQEYDGFGNLIPNKSREIRVFFKEDLLEAAANQAALASGEISENIPKRRPKKPKLLNCKILRSYTVLALEIYHPEVDELTIFAYYYDVYKPDFFHFNCFSTHCLETQFTNFSKFEDAGKYLFYPNKESLLLDFYFFLTMAINPQIIISWKRHQFGFQYLKFLFKKYTTKDLSEMEDYYFHLSASSLILKSFDNDRFHNYSYLMHKHFNKVVPRFSNLKNLCQTAGKVDEIYVYFMVKIYSYAEQSVDPIMKLLEQASLCSTQVMSSISRSMYCIEGVTFPMIMQAGYLPYDKSTKQVKSQEATECIPCCLEPETGLYTDPISVLDFQSLYPSIISGFGFDYGTYLGKLGEVEILIQQYEQMLRTPPFGSIMTHDVGKMPRACLRGGQKDF